jgi:hypothetical protein
MATLWHIQPSRANALFGSRIASALISRMKSPAMPVGHDGAAGELFVKGGSGRAPGGYNLKSIFESHHGARAIQKMKPTESET